MSDGRGKWKRPEHTLDSLLANAMPIPFCGCYVWMGAINQKGYGRISHNGARTVVHRLTYTFRHGPVPEGKDLDHLCRVTGCINPDHTEPVTRLINTVRGEAAKINKARMEAITHCPQGHPYVGENLFIRSNRNNRECRACMRTRQAARRPLKAEGILP